MEIVLLVLIALAWLLNTGSQAGAPIETEHIVRGEPTSGDTLSLVLVLIVVVGLMMGVAGQMVMGV